MTSGKSSPRRFRAELEDYVPGWPSCESCGRDIWTGRTPGWRDHAPAAAQAGWGDRDRRQGHCPNCATEMIRAREAAQRVNAPMPCAAPTLATNREARRGGSSPDTRRRIRPFSWTALAAGGGR